MAAKRPGREGRPWRRLADRVRREEDVCHLCGTPIDKTLEWPHPQSFTVDHVVPVSHAPHLARDRQNLRACHLSCNSAKGNGNPTPTLITSEPW